MVDSASVADTLRQRLGDESKVSGEMIYRGGTVRGFNGHEFKRNAVIGTAFDIFELSGDAEAVERPVMGTRPRDLPLDFDRHREQAVTGGITDSLGTAAFFGHASGRAVDLPLVLFLDPDRVEDPIYKVEYSYDWFDSHPGALAHAETLADGEIYVNGDLWATTDSRAGEGAKVQAWGRDRMVNRTTSPTYQPEREILAFAPKVDLDSSFRGIASYYSEPGPTGAAIDTVLNELPGYATLPGFGGEEEDLRQMSIGEMAMAAHEETSDMMQYDPDDPGYWVIITTDRPEFSKGDTRIEDEQFVVATDGDRVVESPEMVPGMMLGRE